MSGGRSWSMPIVATAVTIGSLAACSSFVVSSARAAPPSLLRRPCAGASIVRSILGLRVRSPIKRILLGIESCTYPSTAPHAEALTTITFQAVAPTEFALAEKGAMRATPGGVTEVRGIGQGAWETNSAIYVLDGHQEIGVQATSLTAVQSPAKAM